LQRVYDALGVLEHRAVVFERAVPLEHQKLWRVQSAAFTRAKAVRELKQPRYAAGEQPFHVQLR
jgi:hypothetical protein